MNQFLKSLFYIILLAPIRATAMESQPDKIEIGKQLFQAASKLDWIAIEKLINADADLNQKDNDGWTVLIFAAWYNRSKIAQMLITAGAELNQKDNDGRNALIVAAWGNHSEIAQMLITAGAELNQKDNNGKTALIGAAQWNYLEIAQILITAGAELNQKDNDGRSALMWAAEQNHSQICRMIVLAHLTRIEQQKNRVYTALNCFKHIFQGQHHNVQDCFKPHLKAMIQEERRTLIDEINQIKNNDIKNELLALCNQMNTQNPQQDQQREEAP